MFYVYIVKPIYQPYFIVINRLVRLHTNVNKSLPKLAPFIFNEWKFDSVGFLASDS